jgi:lipid-binding SYLF domain-containing protein
MKLFLTLLTAAVLAGSFGRISLAGNDKAAEESKRMTDAAITLEEIAGIREGGIPQSMMENAAAIVVIPGLVKAGFIIGGKRGKGVMSVRNDDGWSRPSFVTLTGGSVGWQAGVQSTDLVLVFMSRKNVTALLDGEFTLGADASVAVGPVGREAGAGTNLPFKAEIYSYSRSRGVFAGISVDGSRLNIDTDANARFYGKGTKTEDLLFGARGEVPESAEQFRMKLDDVSRKSDESKESKKPKESDESK